MPRDIRRLPGEWADMDNRHTVYVNGRFVPESEAHVSIFDSALVWGDMVFETTRSFVHKPFKLRDHLERLSASMVATDIELDITIDELEAVTDELVHRNDRAYPPDVDFTITHNVSPGMWSWYSSDDANAGRPTVTIHTWSLVPYIGPMGESFETGVHAYVPRQRAIPGRLLDPKVKNRSRMHYRLAWNQTRHHDAAAWAVLLDEDGYLTEGTGSNFFIVRDGVLMTPEPRNILRGITRQTIMDLAGSMGIPVREVNLEPYDLIVAQEAFFASTPFVIMPATSFNDKPVGDGAVGPITLRLLDAFSETVGVDIVAQAQAFGGQLGDS